ncbi:MAG: cation:proton antiporter, partial [Flavobacteriales bacterium]
MLHTELPFFVLLLILLLAARVFGEIFEYFNQPSLIGEIVAGILLGPAVFGLIEERTTELKTFGDMGLFLLIIRAGMEIQLSDLKKSIVGKNFWIAICGFVIPFSSGLLVGWIFDLNKMVTIFMSLCISITALPVSVRILMDLKMLNTPIGQRIISVAIFNDVLALMILGVLLQIHAEPDNSLTEIFINVGKSLGKVLLFFAAILITNRILFQTTQ